VKVEVSFCQEGGVNRGGEDVWLDVTLKTKTHPNQLTTDVVTQALAKLRSELALEPDEDLERSNEVLEEEESEHNEDVWVQDDQLLSRESSSYDFSVDESWKDFEAFVRRVARRGDWHQRVKTGVYSVLEEFGRNGNAD
jgi:hypothetical protein